MKKDLKVVSLLSMIVFLLLACTLTSVSTPEPTVITEPSIIETVTPQPTETTAVFLDPTPTVNLDVIITAETGSLSIRRGPSIYYNLLGYLQIGQSATATARDSTGGWLYIAIPDNPSASGWVADGTQYSSVQGDISSLDVKTVGPADPIIIRNCTYHPMLVKPGDLLLSPQNEPSNMGQVPPGDYSAYDQSVNNTQVKTMSVMEGDTITIYTDGLNNTYACP